jgi:hypothetical protein
LINAGDLSGVQVGDVYNLTNETHYWSGTPCASTYYGGTADASPDQVIQITIVTPNQNVAVGTIISTTGNHAEMGAEVTINQLVAAAPNAPARNLKKYIVLEPITASPISVPGGATFDFQSVMNNQIVNVLTQTGDYIFSVQ